MYASIRYALGVCLQVVGLLNVVFLVGVPIWLAGRRLCRDARTSDRSLSVAERRTAGIVSTSPLRNDSDPLPPDRPSPSSSESRSGRRVPVRRD